MKPMLLRFVPKGAVKVADKRSDAVAYLYTNAAAKPCARVFYGKQSKPVLACYFRDAVQRERSIATAFDSRRRYLATQKEWADKRKAWVPTYKVGDIFRTCWGYEQTNVEYFEIVEIKGKHAMLRELAQERVNSAWAQGSCVPLPGQYVEPTGFNGADRGKPIRRLMQEGRIRIDDVRTAWPVESKMIGGIKVVSPSSWSAYH